MKQKYVLPKFGVILIFLILVPVVKSFGISYDNPSKYDTLKINEKEKYAIVKIYRQGKKDGAAPRFKLRSNADCLIDKFTVNDSTLLATRRLAGKRVVFVWSGTNKTIYLDKVGTALFYITEGGMTASVKLDLEFGNTYYIKCDSGSGFWEGTPVMKLVDNETGESEFVEKQIKQGKQIKQSKYRDYWDY